MANYTLHMVFNTVGTEYHIYGARHTKAKYKFGKTYGIQDEVSHKINLKELAKWLRAYTCNSHNAMPTPH